MKIWRTYLLVSIAAALFSCIALIGQEGPGQTGSATVAKPKKKDTGDAPKPPSDPAADPDADLPKIPSKLVPKKDAERPPSEASFKVDTQVVSVDVAVVNDKGQFIPGLPKNAFRVLEDGVPQPLTNFALSEAPETVCLLVEFSNKFQSYYGPAWFQTLTAVYGFAQTLRKDDYVAVIAYDLRPEILSDFSNDRQKTYEALQRLRIAGFSEANSLRRFWPLQRNG